jgi:hypothetical protein
MEEIDPELHARFTVLCDQAAEYRRLSYGRNRDLPRTEEHRRAVHLLSYHLWLIGDLTNRHPELRDEYRAWRQIYPTFTSEV